MVFLYKDSIGTWNTASNLRFIAKHRYCRAIPKEVIIDLGYKKVSDFVYDLNSDKNKDKSFDTVVLEYELY